MQRDFVPVLVQTKTNKELWRIDVTDLSVTELIKLKEELKKSPHERTIIALDAIIRSNVESITPANIVGENSYIRTHKKNKKEEIIKRKMKNRRKHK